MNTEKSTIQFAAICGCFSVVTTLGIHLGFPEFSSSFNERLLLFENSIYLLNRWWVIVHCLLVIVSMWGFYLVQRRKAHGLSGLGFLFFAVFGITEIARQLFVLFYLNGLRTKYLNTESLELREMLKLDIENFDLIGNSLFGLFILAFALGNLFYGLSLLSEMGWTKILGVLMVIWSLGNFTTLAIEFLPNRTLGWVIELYSYTFQPLLRGLISVWLWEMAGAEGKGVLDGIAKK